MSLSPFSFLVAALALLRVAVYPAVAARIDARDFGARGDGVAKDHAAIQQAVEAAAAQGGGTVYLPAGRYVCGTIELRSHTRLCLEAGATILGSADAEDYRRLLAGENFETGDPSQPHNRDQSLLVAHDAQEVGICGPGTIDARGENFYDFSQVQRGYKAAVRPWRPGPTVAFFDCTDVTLSDFSLRQNPFFAVDLVGCTSARITGLRIVNDHRFQNGDGIHITRSRGVTISDCQIDTEDDALGFFTNREGVTQAAPECSGITVTNCVLASSCSGIRIGYSGDGVLGPMTFSNLIVRRATGGIDFICTARNTYAGETGTAGPAIHDITFSNIVLDDCDWGITANHAPAARAPGGLRGLHFADMAVRSRRGNYLAGNAVLPIRDVTFRDVDFRITGALGPVSEQAVDPLPIFATKTWLPHAFLLRNVEEVSFHDCRLRWEGATGAWRDALRVEAARAVDCRTLRAEAPPGGEAISARDAQGLFPAK